MPARVVIGIPCLLLGGSEMAALFFAKALLRYGYNTTLCCYYEHDEEMVRRFERVGVETCLLGLPRGGLPALGSLLRALVRFFHARQPEVVHVQYLAPGTVPILAAA